MHDIHPVRISNIPVLKKVAGELDSVIFRVRIETLVWRDIQALNITTQPEEIGLS